MPEPDDGRRSRRAFLISVAASGAALVTFTAGQSFRWLGPTNLLAPRVQRRGPQSVPVNRTAAQAGVRTSASDPSWRLSVSNGTTRVAFSRDELLALPQTEVVLPIACVEGWSTQATWRGVRVRDLVAAVGGSDQHDVRFTSLEPAGLYRVMVMGDEYVQDPLTLVALELNGAVLDIEHGYPARVIAPGRPGVLQTKWLDSMEVLG